MNNRSFVTTFAVLGVLGLLSWLSYRGLSQNPLKALVFRLTPGISGTSTGSAVVEAFQVTAPLDGREAQVQSIRLPAKLQAPLKLALSQRSLAQLLDLSKPMGSWPILVGMEGEGEGWPWYFGGGFKGLTSISSEAQFDNLQFWDRLALCFTWPVPPPAPFATIPLEGLENTPTAISTPVVMAQAVVPTPLPVNGEVRLEILNGCGITNAADWVARRVQGSGLTVTGTTNADNFHYSHSVLQTAVGVPVALEEVLDRLGLTKDDVQEVPSLAAPNDAVLIVGKDYRKLRERYRDRLHHRP